MTKEAHTCVLIHKEFYGLKCMKFIFFGSMPTIFEKVSKEVNN